MAETYYLGAYWGPRKESAEECARRADVFLRGMAQVDPLFARWFKKARSRKEALNRPLDADPRALQQHVQRSIMRDDTRAPIEDLGFSVWLWNGGSGPADVDLNFLCGGCCEQVSNTCLVHLPSTGPAAERILTASGMARVLLTMIVAWEPDWAVAMSNAHLRLVTQDANPDVYVSWLTYLSRRRGTVPPLPAPVRIERIEDLGTLITLTPERFTVANPEHLALAERVRELLDRAGLLVPGRT